jgi:hypothetical protein
MKRYSVPKFIGIIALATAVIFVFSFFVMYLWNETLPGLFHFPSINLWQALDLLLLSRLLFGGLRGPWAGRQNWKNRINKTWMNMTAEEKEKFKEEWGNRDSPFKGEKPQT